MNIDADVVKPAVQQDAVDKVLDGDAKKALSGAVVARGRDNTRGVIPPERMGEVVTFVPDGSSLKTEVNVEAARAILTEGLGPTEKQRRNADIKFSGCQPFRDPLSGWRAYRLGPAAERPPGAYHRRSARANLTSPTLTNPRPSPPSKPKRRRSTRWWASSPPGALRRPRV